MNAFLTGFDGQRQYGLRVNTLKMNLEEFERNCSFSFKKSSVDFKWNILQRRGMFQQSIPFYSAGLYYLQEQVP